MSFIEYEFNLEIVAETMVWQHSFSLKPNKLIQLRIQNEDIVCKRDQTQKVMSKFLASFVKLTDSVKVHNEPTGLSSSKWMGKIRYHMLANAQKNCAAPPCVSY